MLLQSRVLALLLVLAKSDVNGYSSSGAQNKDKTREFLQLFLCDGLWELPDDLHLALQETDVCVIHVVAKYTLIRMLWSSNRCDTCASIPPVSDELAMTRSSIYT